MAEEVTLPTNEEVSAKMQTAKITENKTPETSATERDPVFEEVYQYIIQTIFQFFRVERLYYRFAGEVASTGVAGTPFFKKLSIEKTATGTYKFTHNFHTTNYTIVATPKATSAKYACLHAKNENDCTIKIYNSSATAEDNAFEFVFLFY